MADTPIVRPYEDDSWLPRPMAPQPFGKGPGGGSWNADQEQNFQTYMAFDPNVRAWRNGFESKFGEKPNVNGDQFFDYRKAVAGNDGPRAYAHDTMPHWGSTGKSENHPTEWMNDFMGRFGLDPNEVKSWSPDMQQFMSDQLTRFRAKAFMDAFGLRGN